MKLNILSLILMLLAFSSSHAQIRYIHNPFKVTTVNILQSIVLDTTYDFKDYNGNLITQIEFDIYNSVKLHEMADVHMHTDNGLICQRDSTLLNTLSYDYAKLNRFGDPVGPFNDWTGDRYRSLTLVRYNYDPEPSEEDIRHLMNRTWRYLPFELTLNGSDKHYGWIKIRCDVNIVSGSLTIEIEGYAYEETAGKAISSGDDGNIPSTVKSLDNDLSTQIFPNPSNGLIRFRSKSNTMMHSHIQIFDPRGQLVYDEDFMENDQSVLLQAPGMYIIVLNEEDRTVTQKVIIR